MAVPFPDIAVSASLSDPPIRTSESSLLWTSREPQPTPKEAKMRRLLKNGDGLLLGRKTFEPTWV